ncbi:Serine/threonine-protein kinase, partial [Coelomomyces lativittatus]
MDWCACGDVARFLKLKAVRHGGEEASLDQLHSSVIQLAQGMQLILEDMALGGVWGGIHPLIAIYFLGQLVQALEFLKAHSLMHRDLKPQNLLLHPPPHLPSIDLFSMTIELGKRKSSSPSTSTQAFPTTTDTLTPNPSDLTNTSTTSTCVLGHPLFSHPLAMA